MFQPFGSQGGALSALKPRSNAIALIGHSMLDQGMQQNGSGANRDLQFSLRAPPAWLSILSNGRYRFPENCKFAVSGTTSEDVNSTVLPSGKTQLQSAIECPAGTVMLWTGHNDRKVVPTPWPLTRTKAAITATVQALVAAGKTVILLTPIPSGNASFASWRFIGEQLRAHMGLRQWMIDKAPALAQGRIFTVDLWPVLADQSATDGDVLANVTQDGVHSNARGAYLCAQKILIALDGLGLPFVPTSVSVPGDIYNGADNPSGSLLAATTGQMYASTAAPPANAGGVTWVGIRPSGWTYDAKAPAQLGTLTITGSVVTNARGKWYQWQIVGTTAAYAAAPEPRLFIQQALALGNLNAGDVLAASGEFEIDANSTGLVSFQQDLSRLLAGGATYDAVRVLHGDTSGGVGSGVLDAILAGLPAPLAGMFASNLTVTYAASDANVTLYHCIRLKEGQAVNATIRMRNAAVRKILAG